MSNLYMPRQDDGDNLKEFTVSKSDPKYQTLPYNTKFTVNLLPNRIGAGRPDNLVDNNNELLGVTTTKDIVEGTTNHISSGHNMTVHSAPLSVVNKNIATPLNQNDLISRKTNNEHHHNIIMNGGSSTTTTTTTSSSTTNNTGMVYQVST